MKRHVLGTAVISLLLAGCSDRLTDSEFPRAAEYVAAGQLASATVVAGGVHSCALAADGTAYCWGNNSTGQLGSARAFCYYWKVCSVTPVAVRGGIVFQALAAGNLHTCGVTPGGDLYCWGDNALGQLGTTSNESCEGWACSSAPLRVGGGFKAVGTGAAHTCALTTSGQAYCWGDNQFGQLGGPGGGTTPVAVPGGLAFTSLVVGGNHACALTADGAAWCWGQNDLGQLGAASSDVCGPLSSPCSRSPVRVTGGLAFASLAAGHSHTCGIATGTATAAVRSPALAADASLAAGASPSLPRTPPPGGTSVVRLAVLPLPLASAAAAAPATPSGLSSQVQSSSRIDLAWTDNSWNEAGFQVRRSAGGGSWHIVAQTGANVTTYSDVGLAEATQYAYRVRSFNGGGASKWSNETRGTTRLNTPGSLAAAARSAGRIDLSWTDNSARESGYEVYRKTAATAYALLARLGANATAYADGAVQAGATYTYQVRAYNLVTTSLWSDPASATAGTAPAQPPAAPTGLAAGAVSASQIDLTWRDASGDEAGFAVERRTGSAGFAEIGRTGPNATTYSSTGLQAGTTYTYRVRAFNAAGSSAYSNEASAATHAPPTSGNAYCWGGNASGELGIASLAGSVATPTAVYGGIAFRWLTGGADHTCGIAADGRGYCWGSNGTAQLGTGSYGVGGNSRVPAAVYGGYGWSRLGGGGSHTCGVTGGGLTYCWGSHVQGQVGDGSLPLFDTRRPTPTPVANPSR